VLYPVKAIETQGSALTGAIATLLEQGILRKEWFAGEQRLEISHDLLLRPVRHAVEEAKAAKKRWRLRLIAAALVAGLVAAYAYQRQAIVAELERNEVVYEALLVAYVPLLPTDPDPERLRNEMAALIEKADLQPGGLASVGDLKRLLDRAVEIGRSTHPVTARRLVDTAISYIQVKIDRGNYRASELESLLLKLRDSVGASCKKGFMTSGDKVANWFADHGGIPAECQ
jgi:hypothetical protein